MRTGFNLLLWMVHVTENHFPLLGKLEATGYDGVEIALFEGDPAHDRKVGWAIRAHDLACTTVTVLPDQAHSAISADAASRKGALEHLRWAIECSAALDSESEDELAWGAEGHRKAGKIAGEAGIALAIEPLNRFECDVLTTMADAPAHVRRVDHANFGAPLRRLPRQHRGAGPGRLHRRQR